MNDKPTDIDVFDETRTQERIIAEAVWAVRPKDATWDQIVFRFMKLGRRGSKIAFIHSGSDEERAFVSNEAMWAAEELRKLAYKPGVGTWVEMTLTIAPDGNGWETSYNFDQEPLWESGAPGDDEYAVEQYIFPRDASHIPDWFAKELATAEWVPDSDTMSAEDLRKYTP